MSEFERRNREKQHLEMVTIAKAILEKRIGLVEGSRSICVLSHALNMANDEDLLFFIAIDSESDDLVVGRERPQWNQEVLKLKDQELRRFEEAYILNAIPVCQNLIRRFGNEQ